jgi:hypothetical protein
VKEVPATLKIETVGELAKTRKKKENKRHQFVKSLTEDSHGRKAISVEGSNVPTILFGVRI